MYYYCRISMYVPNGTLHVSFHPHVRVFNGYLPTVFVTDLGILKQILVKQFSIFSNREVKLCLSVRPSVGACLYRACVKTIRWSS